MVLVNIVPQVTNYVGECVNYVFPVRTEDLVYIQMMENVIIVQSNVLPHQNVQQVLSNVLYLVVQVASMSTMMVYVVLVPKQILLVPVM